MFENPPSHSIRLCWESQLEQLPSSNMLSLHQGRMSMKKMLLGGYGEWEGGLVKETLKN
jgi:hypothetical protein